MARSRILYRDGVPVLALEGGEVKPVEPGADAPTAEMVQALVRKQLTPALRARLALSGVPAGNTPPRRPARRRSQRKVASQARPREPVE